MNYEEYYKSYCIYVLQLGWRDSSIDFLNTKRSTLISEMYDSEKTRIETRFVKYTAEHYLKYVTFLDALKGIKELRNVSNEVLYDEDFLQGLEEDMDIKKAIEIELNEIINRGAI